MSSPEHSYCEATANPASFACYIVANSTTRAVDGLFTVAEIPFDIPGRYL